MTTQNKKRLQDIMKMAEEDVSQAKEKTMAWLKEGPQ